MDIDYYRYPNVVVFGSEGGTFWKPMNLSIIYGLAVTTFLTLFWVPVFYSIKENSKTRLKQLKQKVFGGKTNLLNACAEQNNLAFTMGKFVAHEVENLLNY